MKTITFYSYKGGVGRSLVLANIAQRLVEFGKSVCMLDFDLEAPGLPFKFGAKKILDMKKRGIVDFVTEYQNTLNPPQNLDGSYYIHINPDRKNQAPLFLITAGNTDSIAYWKNLATIDWKHMFYSKDGQGYRLMLHLKALIEKELKPDYLLIDSRTGVTETSGITLSVLADRIVIVAANNEENCYGSKMIIKGIQQEKQPNGLGIDVHFILSRVPFTKEPNDRLREKDKVDELTKELKDERVDIAAPGILLIHSERELEETESLKIGEFKTEEPIHIGDDYRKIFKYVISKDFAGDEIEKYEHQENASSLFDEFNKEKDSNKKLELINKCIELNPKSNYFLQRALLTEDIEGQENNVIQDYEMTLSLEPNNPIIYLLYGLFFILKDKREQGMNILTRGISINPNESILYSFRAIYETDKEKKLADLLTAVSIQDSALNLRNLAEYYFDAENYADSYSYAYKSFEKNSKDGGTFFLLAKLQHVYKNNLDEFYLNLDRALELDNQLASKIKLDKFFHAFLNDTRFQRMLYKYNIEMKLDKTEETGNKIE